MACKFGELRDYFDRLQSRLRNYATLKTRLDTKGEEVRKEITRQVEEEGELLRAREKQLLRQVDVAAAHFMSVYLVHHAHLHQLVGAAQTFLDRHPDSDSDAKNDKGDDADDKWLKAQEDSGGPGSGDVEKEIQELVDRIRTGLKVCDLTREDGNVNEGDVPIPISVAFPKKTVEELERCIMDFGEVTSAGHSFHMRAPFHGDDVERKGFGFLPYGHEDYLDSEAEVLQSKPLLGTPSLIRFPRKLHPVPQQVGFPVEEKNRWLLQHLEKSKSAETELNIKPQNDEPGFGRKKSGSSCSESIEILGSCSAAGDDDADEAHWLEDDEFVLLKTFCGKRDGGPCAQLTDCCVENLGQRHCLKRALEKPTTAAVPAVNINNRSVSSRCADWLLLSGLGKKTNNSDNVNGNGGKQQQLQQQQVVVVVGAAEVQNQQFKTAAWKTDGDAGAVEWRRSVGKHWERIWKADNETWLIRRKRIEDSALAANETPAAVSQERQEIEPALAKQPTFERSEKLNNCRWIISRPQEAEEESRVDDKTGVQVGANGDGDGGKPKTEEERKEKIWRLPYPTSETESASGDGFFFKIKADRDRKCAADDWLRSSRGNDGNGNDGDEDNNVKTAVAATPRAPAINYKAWLAPACNSSPHAEKFVSAPVRSSPIRMEKNLFSSGLTVKSNVWLLKSGNEQ